MLNKKWVAIPVEKIPPRKLANLLKKKNAYILDVRPVEFKRDKSFIKGSTHCPLVYLMEYYQAIPKDRPIVITDWAMKQSTTAARFLKNKGYQVLGVLKGGLERWKEEALPVEEWRLSDKPFQGMRSQRK